jgi:hypothetical protein
MSPVYEEASRRALTTAPKVNTVAANMKTARETERGTPDRLIKIQRIVPTRKPNQIPNSSSEWRSVMSTPLRTTSSIPAHLLGMSIGMATLGPHRRIHAQRMYSARMRPYANARSTATRTHAATPTRAPTNSTASSCLALSGQCQPQCRPRKRQEFVNELHRACSWKSATGSAPPLD